MLCEDALLCLPEQHTIFCLHQCPRELNTRVRAAAAEHAAHGVAHGYQGGQAWTARTPPLARRCSPPDIHPCLCILLTLPSATAFLAAAAVAIIARHEFSCTANTSSPKGKISNLTTSKTVSTQYPFFCTTHGLLADTSHHGHPT